MCTFSPCISVSRKVGFQVFSDFMTYKNGTYFRTKSAQGPRGGHAVKIVG